MTALHEIEERIALETLRFQFGATLDARAWDAFTALFTPEVDADFSAWGIPRARVAPEEIAAWMRPAFTRADVRTHQLYTNVAIVRDGDRATIRSSLVGVHAHVEGRHAIVYGRYRDDVVRTSVGWRIAGGGSRGSVCERRCRRTSLPLPRGERRHRSSRCTMSSWSATRRCSRPDDAAPDSCTMSLATRRGRPGLDRRRCTTLSETRRGSRLSGAAAWVVRDASLRAP